MLHGNYVYVKLNKAEFFIVRLEDIFHQFYIFIEKLKKHSFTYLSIYNLVLKASL